MTVNILWIPVSIVGGIVTGGVLGGYFATRGCREKIKRLEEERKQETKEMEEMREKYASKLEKAEKELDDSIAKGMKDISKPIKSAEKTSKRVVDHPMRIDETEFNRDIETGVDHENLTYYRLDSVLTDEHDEVVDDPTGLIGKDVWESLDIVEDETIWARNYELEMDFEINIDASMSYYRDVAGSAGV